MLYEDDCNAADMGMVLGMPFCLLSLLPHLATVPYESAHAGRALRLFLLMAAPVPSRGGPVSLLTHPCGRCTCMRKGPLGILNPLFSESTDTGFGGLGLGNTDPSLGFIKFSFAIAG